MEEQQGRFHYPFPHHKMPRLCSGRKGDGWGRTKDSSIECGASTKWCNLGAFAHRDDSAGARIFGSLVGTGYTPIAPSIPLITLQYVTAVALSMDTGFEIGMYPK